MADLSETTVLSPGEEERLALGPGTPLGSICLYSTKKMRVCVDPCICSFSLWRYPGGNQECSPALHLQSFLLHSSLLSLCNPQAQLSTFVFTLSVPSFHILTQCLSKPRSPHWEVEAMLCEVATVLCKVDLREMEEARHSYSNISVQKKINMLSVFVSLPLLFD